MLMRIRSSVLLLATLALVAPEAALPQEARGKVLGLISDASGAVIPGAAVVAVQIDMNTATPTRSNAAGLYELPFLLPGLYRLEITAQGFKSYRQEPIEVRVGETATVDVKLEVGAVTESVKVIAEAPLLDESSATVGQTVDRHQLENLPIGGDDVMYLVSLGAGITTTQTPSHNWLPSAVDVMSFNSAAGTRNGSSDFSLDGIPNMTGSNVSFAPPADIVQEFRVDVAKYDASLGHGVGAHVNLSLKAGTNAYHGTANWQTAPTPWQANTFFGNKQLYDLSTGPVTPEKRARMAPSRKVNRYSFTMSGPLEIPRLYHGRNRTFWTYGFQGFNRRNPTSSYLTLPTDDERKGDFSALLALGSRYQIYDPATVQPDTPGRFRRQPLPGNIIPASRLDPMALRLIGYYPLPNSGGSVNGRDNYQVGVGDSNDFTQQMGRVDHVISDRHRIFTRVTHSKVHFYRGQYFDNESRGLDRYRIQNGVGFDDVYVLTPSFLVNLKYGFTLFTETDGPFSKGMDLVALGFPGPLIAQLDPQAVSFPQITVDQLAGLGESTNTDNTTNYHNWAGSATQMIGSHSVKWGGEYRLMREHSYSFGNGTPKIDFGTNWTRGPLDNATAAPIGQGLASFLFGLPTSGNVDVNASSATQSTYTGLYVQDDWRALRRLTVNIGLRWEYQTSPTERFNRTVLGFDFSTPSPVQAAAKANYAKAPIPEIAADRFTTLGGLTFAGLGGNPRNLFRTSHKNFAPRVGFAWLALPKTVVRGGYGIFYDPLGVTRVSIMQSGFSQRTTLVPTQDNGQSYIATLSSPFPNLLRPSDVGMLTYLGQAVSFNPLFRPAPYVQNWSFSIQRQLPARMVLDVTYMGNRLTRMAVGRDYNTVPRRYLSTSPERDQTVVNLLTANVPNPFNGIAAFAASGLTGQTVARTQLLKPYPEFTSISGPEPVGFTWYHSLQVRLSKRLTRGITYNLNYTFSKMMEAASFLNDTDPLPEHVISSSDRPHRLVPMAVIELPVGRGRRFGTGMNRLLDAAIGGWQVQGIFQWQSGPPIGFGNVLYRGDIHDVVLPADQRTPERWFNTDAFEKTSGKQLGQNIRTFPSRLSGLRADGDKYWDLSATKNFRVNERVRFQLRTNWEGAFNRPLFQSPNNTPTNSLFGSVNATRGEARRIYAGLKMYF